MNELPKIKILHITQVGGGIETYLEQIVKNIDRQRFDIILAAPAYRTSLEKMATRYEIPFYPIKLKWQISPIHDIISIFSMIKLEKKIKPDIIHAHSSKAGMIVRLARLFYKSPVVYTPNGFAYLGKTGIKRKIFVAIEKLAIPLTDTLLASSVSEKKRCLADLSFPKNKVEVYPNSIEILPLPDSPPQLNSKKLVTTVGRLVNQKNPFMFLNVCKKITDIRDDIFFEIIGAGFEDSLRKGIEKFIEDNNLCGKIGIIDWMNRSDLLTTIRSTDVFVMTSAFESFGYVAAEAQMLEVPVVATNVDGLNEIVKDNDTGYLIDLNDSTAMAEKICLLIDNPIEATEMGKRGRIRVSDLFSITKNIVILERFYLNKAGKSN